MPMTRPLKPSDFWRAKSAYATKGRRYWAPRAVSCSACGCDAKHYLAEIAILEWRPLEPLFTVPFAGLNGGIGEEIEASYWLVDEGSSLAPDLSLLDGAEVYLSRCCDAPRFRQRRRRRP